MMSTAQTRPFMRAGSPLRRSEAPSMACRTRRAMSSVSVSTDHPSWGTCLSIKAPKLQSLLEKTMQPSAGYSSISPFPPNQIPISLWIDCNSCLITAFTADQKSQTAGSVSADANGFHRKLKGTLNFQPTIMHAERWRAVSGHGGGQPSVPTEASYACGQPG